ncbi:MAG: UDP-N-acetylmuramoyl-L-alanine--D-glutamate ligase [Anaerolineae bacterium]|nr:UDP-N-acetylmuramoyl-L-alanine--D-glutamate ligase [Phycisphaerae bacterium]
MRRADMMVGRLIMDDLQNKHVTVAGLGHFGGGIAVSRWLAQAGAKVLVTDQAPAEKLADSIRQLHGLPIEFRLGEHRRDDFTQADLVVTSPAIPPTNEFLVAARGAGVPITTEIRLFIERCPAKIIGVTGTKGKSTTTKLLSLMLAGRNKVWTGGNIGGSLLFDLPQIDASDLVVLELSSYMLEHLRSMRWSPHVAVVNMISVDHIEWHGSEAAYIDAKRNIVRFQSADDIAVLSDQNEESADFENYTKARIVKYGIGDRQPFALTIPGRHNQLNAQAAFAAASELGIPWDDAQAAIKDFSGLPHRLQLVHTTADDVRYFNDSIATIPEAAVAALESFPARRVIQIVGGYDKHLDMSALCTALAQRAKAAMTIGALGPALAESIRQSFESSCAIHECGELSNAIAMARKIASPGDIVLLSTGCASYDQFTNFQVRGEQFASLAKGSR